MSKLTNGAPLVVEDLDLSGLGMYSDQQKAELRKSGVPESDFFLRTLNGTTMWARHSDEGGKWRVFYDSGIKLWKDLNQKSIRDTMDEHMVKTSSAKRL